MSASLLNLGDELLLVYLDHLPGMPVKGMVARRSGDGGRRWSDAAAITPANGNRHSANNASLRRLADGRILLAAREYIDGVRWPPYCLLSDDGGSTWHAGAHVPDPGLPERERLAPERQRAERRAARRRPPADDHALGVRGSSSSPTPKTAGRAGRGRSCRRCAARARRRRCSECPAATTCSACGRTVSQAAPPLVTALSSDAGRSWRPLKLVERSRHHGYCYTSITFHGEHVLLTYSHAPELDGVRRFEVEPGYIDLRLTALPVQWFYRAVT